VQFKKVIPQKLTMIILLVGVYFLFPQFVFADDIQIEESPAQRTQGEQVEREIFKGKIIGQEKVDCGMIGGGGEIDCFSYKVEVLDGQRKGDIVETMPTWVTNEEALFKKGSKVYLSKTEDFEGEEVWTVESYSRESTLLILVGIFVFLIILITGMRGLRATIGLFISFCTIYFFAIPRINTGSNFFLISTVAIFILLCAVTFVTYGLNKKSLIAFGSTLLGILIILAIGYIVTITLDINGLGEEEAAMLLDTTQGAVKLSWVFLLSVVIGALGVLDDVTVGQVSSMLEIYETDKTLAPKELFRKAMNVGKDHIASMVNTLFIAYAGSSFALVMLLSANSPDFRILINEGFIVEEIVRTLVASIGLILVVPLTSFIASRLVVKVLK
jgi:uncharacterized membrane protein